LEGSAASHSDGAAFLSAAGFAAGLAADFAADAAGLEGDAPADAAPDRDARGVRGVRGGILRPPAACSCFSAGGAHGERAAAGGRAGAASPLRWPAWLPVCEGACV
jgi:hypothetical protein